MSKQRITCALCNKYFIITKLVGQVKCPECGGINKLVTVGDTNNNINNSNNNNISIGHGNNVSTVAPSSLPPSPHFTYREGVYEAKMLLEESPTLWASIKLSYAGVSECQVKSYCLDKEKNEIFVTRCNTTINGKANDIFSVYWNDELEWDTPTVAHLTVVEDHGKERVVYKEHKTTSAATLKNDVYARQGYEEDPNTNALWCFTVSEDGYSEKGGWRRGRIIFSALKIVPVDSNSCFVSFIHCFDFGGWIHVKFVEEEQKRTGLRLSKIKKKVEEVHASAPVPAPVPKSRTSSFTSLGSAPVFRFGSGVVNFCPTCKNVANSAFCSNDGSKLIVGCSKCLTPVVASNFCGSCGNKLV